MPLHINNRLFLENLTEALFLAPVPDRLESLMSENFSHPYYCFWWSIGSFAGSVVEADNLSTEVAVEEDSNSTAFPLLSSHSPNILFPR